MNWMLKISRGGNAGAALLMLMLIILLVCVGSVAMVSIGKQQAYSASLVGDYLTAQAYAEAGVCDAYNILRANWAGRTATSNFPLKTYQYGSYDVDVLSVSSNTALITSTGTCGKSVAVVKMDVKNFNPGGGSSSSSSTSPPTASGVFLCAIMAAGNLTCSGNSTLNTGNGAVHANGTMTMSGNQMITSPTVSSSVGITMSGNSKITGSVSAPYVTFSGNSTVSGTKTIGAVATKTIPSIDLTPYYNVAVANGTYYSSSKTYSGNTALEPAGGVMWINGTLTVSGNVTMKGCFIATGNITLSGNGAQTKVNLYPAVVSRDGSITVSGNASYNGLIYSKTSYSGSGNGQIKGSIISQGDITTSGNFSALVYENSTPVDPTGGGPGSSSGGSGGDRVGVTAWQR